MIKRHKRKAIVVGCAKMLQPGCQVLSEDDHHEAAMARPMHAKKNECACYSHPCRSHQVQAGQRRNLVF